jgi:hypothetical protein
MFDRQEYPSSFIAKPFSSFPQQLHDIYKQRAINCTSYRRRSDTMRRLITLIQQALHRVVELAALLVVAVSVHYLGASVYEAAPPWPMLSVAYRLLLYILQMWLHILQV